MFTWFWRDLLHFAWKKHEDELSAPFNAQTLPFNVRNSSFNTWNLTRMRMRISRLPPITVVLQTSSLYINIQINQILFKAILVSKIKYSKSKMGAHIIKLVDCHIITKVGPKNQKSITENREISFQWFFKPTSVIIRQVW